MFSNTTLKCWVYFLSVFLFLSVFFLHIIISLHPPLQSSKSSSFPIGPQIITRLPTACLNTKIHVFEWMQMLFQMPCILGERGMEAATFLVAMRELGNIKQRFLKEIPTAPPLHKTPSKAAPELWDSLTQERLPVARCWLIPWGSQDFPPMKNLV